MSELTFKAQSPLDGFSRQFDGVTIAEITNRAIVSLATPNGGESALSKAIAASYGAKIPAVGQSTISKAAKTRFLGMQRGQLFLLFDYPGRDALKETAKKLGDTAYLTDQSDAWVMVRLCGVKCRAALERICLIDLHPAAFPEGGVARTSMEHMAAIILREGRDTFLLMSPRSSAKSFLHALETSVRNID